MPKDNKRRRCEARHLPDEEKLELAMGRQQRPARPSVGIGRERGEEIRKGRRRKGRGGIAGTGAEECVEILDRGDHGGSEKGERRGGLEKGWKAGGDARRYSAGEWWRVQQMRKSEAGP
jgi:hypothetical protein